MLFSQVAEAVCGHHLEHKYQGSRQTRGTWPPGAVGRREHSGLTGFKWVGVKPRKRIQWVGPGLRSLGRGSGHSGVSYIGSQLFSLDLWQWSLPLLFLAWVRQQQPGSPGSSSCPPYLFTKARAKQLPFRILADPWGLKESESSGLMWDASCVPGQTPCIQH